MAGAFSPITRFILTDNGTPVPGALLYTYLSGGSTPSPVYTTSALNVEHANPVEADASGMFPAIYLGDRAYRFLITDADGATIIPAQDNVYDFGQLYGVSIADLDAVEAGGIAIAGQTALDLIIADSATQLGRVPVGSALTYPRVNAAGTGYEFVPISAGSFDDTQASTSTGSETVLYTYTIPANTFAAFGDTVQLTAVGTFAADTDAKTVRVRLGGLAGTLIAGEGDNSASNISWRVEATITRLASNSQRCVGRTTFFTSAVLGSRATQTITTSTATDTGTIALVVTGQGTNAADIVYETAWVEIKRLTS